MWIKYLKEINNKIKELPHGNSTKKDVSALLSSDLKITEAPSLTTVKLKTN